MCLPALPAPRLPRYGSTTSIAELATSQVQIFTAALDMLLKPIVQVGGTHTKLASQAGRWNAAILGLCLHGGRLSPLCICVSGYLGMRRGFEGSRAGLQETVRCLPFSRKQTGNGAFVSVCYRDGDGEGNGNQNNKQTIRFLTEEKISAAATAAHTAVWLSFCIASSILLLLHRFSRTWVVGSPFECAAAET